MARINNIQTNLQSVLDIPALRRFVGAALDSMVTQLNGKLDFGDNIRCVGPLSVVLSGTDPVKVPHTLGRQPLGYLVIQQDAGQTIYAPNQVMYPWTPTQIYLVATGSVNAQVFVI